MAEHSSNFFPYFFGGKRIAILAGGNSSEREISLLSGLNVADALRQTGNEIEIIDPADIRIESVDFSRYHVAFIALHGRYGEDGEIQSLLEERGLPYTGSNPMASRLGLNKSASKERFLLAGLSTPEYAVIHKTDSVERLYGLARTIGYPLVVKPNSHGSSLGVSLVHHPSELPVAFANCFEFDSFGLIEQYIPGEEWTVGLLDRTPLPPIRIETENQLFDYAAKYSNETTRYNPGSSDSCETKERIREVALSAAVAVGTSGLARIDLRVDSFGRPWLLELNTIPGLTRESLVPLAASWIGWNMSELCERAVESAMASHSSKIPQRLTA